MWRFLCCFVHPCSHIPPSACVWLLIVTGQTSTITTTCARVPACPRVCHLTKYGHLRRKTPAAFPRSLPHDFLSRWGWNNSFHSSHCSLQPHYSPLVNADGVFVMILALYEQYYLVNLRWHFCVIDLNSSFWKSFQSPTALCLLCAFPFISFTFTTWNNISHFTEAHFPACF